MATNDLTSIKVYGDATVTGSIEVGNADTTLSRVSAGVISVEGATVPTLTSTSTFATGVKTFLAGMLALRNVANTFSGFFTNTNTADRTYTLKDASGTLAFTSDITGTNSGTNTGDQTSIVGITGTKAQFNTAVTDGDIVYTADSPTLGTITTTGSVELGHASDTTVSRVSAGRIAVEGVNVVTTSSTDTLTNKTLTTPTIASVKGTVTTDTDGATVTFDKNVNSYHRVVLGGNRTLALSNMAAGDKILIDLVQDATGTRIVTWFTTIKWAGGTIPTLTTTANKIDTFGFICTTAGNYQGYIIGQNL